MSALLEIKDVDLFYGDAQALAEVSLEIAKGQIVTIVGANGAGKSSLIRSIAGMEQLRAGKIVFAGSDITGLDSHQICNLGIGHVAEGRQLFPNLTVTENLEMGAMLPRARIMMKQMFAEVFALFPQLAERKKQLAGTLSGGEQQMVAIGRCLMSFPELIMFDEPSLGLAPTMNYSTIRACGRHIWDCKVLRRSKFPRQSRANGPCGLIVSQIPKGLSQIPKSALP